MCKPVATIDASTAITMAALTPPVKCPLDSSLELPPQKHVKCIDISGSPLKHDRANSAILWVQFQQSVLTMTDNKVIEDGHWLKDRHKFCSSQFPHIGELQTTLLQERYYCFPHQSMQGIFCKRHEHWIVASNMLINDTSDMLITDSNTVNVYDLMFGELDQETSTITKNFS